MANRITSAFLLHVYVKYLYDSYFTYMLLVLLYSFLSFIYDILSSLALLCENELRFYLNCILELIFGILLILSNDSYLKILPAFILVTFFSISS